MSNYFTKDYIGEAFVFLGPHHLVALAALLAICIFLFLWRNPSERTKRNFRYSVAAVLILNEMTWHAWNYFNGIWTVQTMLPFHLCSVLVFLSAVMLVTKNYTLYEIIYFLGIGGAIQAYLTPDLGKYGFPHIRFFQVFVSHGSIVIAAIYMTAVEKYRPHLSSILRVLILLTIYAAVIFPLSLLIGSNYLYIALKPLDPSLIDLLPPWPWYILELAGVAVLEFVILYLPFAIKDALKKKN